MSIFSKIKFSWILISVLLVWVVIKPNVASSAIIQMLSDAWFSAGIYVAISLAVFFLIEKAIKVDFNTLLSKKGNKAIFYASLLGAFPGCGGAILVALASVNKKASFGSLVAALTTTMGDSAFLLLAKKPLQTLLIVAIQIITGTLTGILIDYLQNKNIIKISFYATKTKSIEEVSKQCCHGGPSNASKDHNQNENKPTDNQVAGKINLLHIFFMVSVPLSIIWSIYNIVNMIPKNEALSYLSFYYLGAFFGVISIIFWLLNLASLDEHHDHLPTDEISLKDQVSEVMSVTFFVVVWVFIANLLYYMFIALTGIEIGSLFKSIAIFIPLIAIIVGFIPGCGPQIIVASLYVTDIIPFSAQLGNSISNDGDAMLPAMSVAPKIVVYATIYSAIPAFVLAYFWYFAFE